MVVAETLKQIPVLVWLVCAALAVAAVRYATLSIRRLRSAPASREWLGRLQQIVAGLRAYAATHDAALPDSLRAIAPGLAEHFVYRPVPNSKFDERLIVIYDRAPRHVLVEFPMLRAARAVATLGGKTLILSEQQFEKLLAADNGLRVKCGLEPLDLASGSANGGAA